MAKQYDATLKQLVEARPADWLAFAGLPVGTSIEVVDADVSTVTSATDKVLRVSGPEPYVAHLEFQSWADANLDRRVLLYNVLLRWRHRLPVKSAVLLLRPQAQTAGATGRVTDAADSAALLDFRYRLVRVWEQPVEAVLAGGVGTLPLAPISAVEPAALPSVVERISRRLDRDAPPREAADAWASTFVLLGLRYPREVGQTLLKGVRRMEESTTYQWIIEQGEARGEVRGQARGRAEEARRILLLLGTRKFGPPPQDVRRDVDSLEDVGKVEDLIGRVADAPDWTSLLGA